MKKLLYILLFFSVTAISQPIYFSQICGFTNINNCPDSVSGIAWGLQGDWKLRDQLPANFETTWQKYDCVEIKKPKKQDGVLIEHGVIELIRRDE